MTNKIIGWREICEHCGTNFHVGDRCRCMKDKEFWLRQWRVYLHTKCQPIKYNQSDNHIDIKRQRKDNFLIEYADLCKKHNIFVNGDVLSSALEYPIFSSREEHLTYHFRELKKTIDWL